MLLINALIVKSAINNTGKRPGQLFCAVRAHYLLRDRTCSICHSEEQDCRTREQDKGSLCFYISLYQNAVRFLSLCSVRERI